MQTDKLDVVLNINDPKFAQKFAEAVGVKPGDTVEFVTPQFDRTNGVTPVLSVDDWSGLRHQSREALQSIGLQAWDAPDERGKVLMLFPAEWYPLIPAGFVVTSIGGSSEAFVPGETDNDRRFGALAYGVEITEEHRDAD